MWRSIIILALVGLLTACERKVQPSASSTPQDPAFTVDSEFPGGHSVMAAARRVFPAARHIFLADFWGLSADATHEFAVFFAGREISGSFESTYWRYLVFVKKKGAKDWSDARVFDLPDNHPFPWNGSLQSLEHSATELKSADPDAQHNAGDRPPISASPASGIPSSRAPRG